DWVSLFELRELQASENSISKQTAQANTRLLFLMVDLSSLTAKPDSTALASPPSTPTNGNSRARWSREDLLPALAGLMFGLAFAPTNFVPLAFFGLVPLLVYLDGPLTISRLIRASFIFPIAFYGFTLNWLAGMAGFSWLAVPGYMVIVFVY